MGKTVTFSVSTKYEGSTVVEKVTFEELDIDEDMDDKAIKKAVDERFRDWIWNNISFSYCIDILTHSTNQINQITIYPKYDVK